MSASKRARRRARQRHKAKRLRKGYRPVYRNPYATRQVITVSMSGPVKKWIPIIWSEWDPPEWLEGADIEGM